MAVCGLRNGAIFTTGRRQRLTTLSKNTVAKRDVAADCFEALTADDKKRLVDYVNGL